MDVVWNAKATNKERKKGNREVEMKGMQGVGSY